MSEINKERLVKIISVGALTMIYGFTFGLAVKLADSGNRRYVVVDKADNKIVFEDVDEMRTHRIMDFDIDANGKFHNYYEYINVGDTITGQTMHSHLVVPPYTPTTTVSKVLEINGKNASYVLEMRKQAAHRDSMIVKMNNQKQK